jgi:hypothetical protein
MARLFSLSATATRLALTDKLVFQVIRHANRRYGADKWLADNWGRAESEIGRMFRED